MSLARTMIIAAAACFAPAAFADQPNMEAALASLQQAKDSLVKATPDKGGHRAKALKLVDDAIAQTKAGIEYAKTHPKK